MRHDSQGQRPHHGRVRFDRFMDAGRLLFSLLAWASVFFALFPLVSNGHASTPANVLLINAYHPGYRWSDQLVAGLRDTLMAAAPQTRLYVEHLDSKRLYSAPAFDRLADLIGEKYRHISFNAIVAADDNSIRFLKQHRHSLFAGTPAVICGANDLNPADLDGMAPVTGVNEAADVRETIDLALNLIPAVRRIVVVNDTTSTGRQVHREIQRASEAFSDRVAFVYWDDLRREDLIQRLAGLKHGDMVLYTFFFRDRSGDYFAYDDSARRICSASPVPVFGLWEFNLGFGIIGGKLVSGVTQGQAAGKMVLRILDGEKTDAIPLLMESPNRFAFDYNVLKRFGLSDSDLPADSLIINRPMSFYEEYRTIIWCGIVAIVGLIILIFFLLASIDKRRKMEMDLRESRQSLESITDNIPGVVYQFHATANGQYGLNYVNDKVFEIFDLQATPETFFEAFSARIHEDDRERFFNSIADAVAAIAPWHFEGRFVKSPDGVMWFSGNAVPRKMNGQIVFDGVLMDITERRTAETALAESETLLRLFVEYTPAAVAMCDTKMNYLAYSRRWITDYHLPDSDLKGRCHYDVFEVIPERWKTQHQRCFKGEVIESEEEPFVRADGTRDWVRRSLHPWRTMSGDIGGLILFTEVVTRKKLVEENLRLMERVLNNSPAVLFRWKPVQEWPVTFVTDNVSQFGYQPEELFSGGIPFTSMVHPDDLARVNEEVKTFSRQRRSDFIQEYRILTKDGDVRWVDGRTMVAWDEDGKISYFQGVLMDITDRKKAQEEVNKRQLFLESVLYHAPDAVITLDAKHRVIDWNPGAEKIFGYTHKEALGNELDRLVSRDEISREADAKTRCVLSGQRVEAFETVRYRKGGAPVHVIAAGSPIMVDGTLTAVVAMYTDVTALKQAENELRRNERMLRRIMDMVPSMIFVKNGQGRFLMANRAVADSYGLTVEELIGTCQADIHPDPDQAKLYLAADKRAMENGAPLFVQEEPFLDHRGATRWLEVTKLPCDVRDFGEPAIVGLATDITERRAVEARIQESEKRYRIVFENTGTGTVLSENDTTLSMVNSEFADMVGYTREEIEGKMSWTRLIAPEDVARMKSYHVARRKAPAAAPSQWECNIVDRAGKVKRMLLKVRMIPGTQTSIGSFLDITERKKAEEELQQLRNYLSNIINSMPSVLVGVDTEGRVTQWNKQAVQMTGMTFEKVRSQPVAVVFPRLMDEMDRIRTAITDRRVLRDPKIPRRENGETRFEDVTIFPLVANGVEGAVIRVDDVTDRVRMEEMMIQSEKMLSVGGLAAGMAHEINNPLAGILQNTAVLDNRLFGELPANRKAAETAGTTMPAIRHYLELRKLPTMLDNIRTSGKRAAAIVKNMLSFARKSDRIISSHDLALLLNQTIELARTDYNMKKRYDFKQIEMVREYDNTVAPVPCEGSKIQQVFLNILKNGAEAMADQKDRQAPPIFILRVKADEPWVRVEIEDNGPGMDEKTRRRIFEPFFTTKPVGEGTGLGLSVSYFIITENHGGKMDVQSTDSGGTRFVIRLPKTGTG